jgi:signal transduction histidine kinase
MDREAMAGSRPARQPAHRAPGDPPIPDPAADRPAPDLRTAPHPRRPGDPDLPGPGDPADTGSARHAPAAARSRHDSPPLLPTRRAALLTIAVGVPPLAGITVLAQWPFTHTGRTPLLVADAVVAVAFFVTGIIVGTDHGHRVTALALLAGGLLWPLNWVNEWNAGIWPLVAALDGPLASVLVGWALVRYPRHWPRRRDDLLVAGLCGLSQLLIVAHVVTSTAGWYTGFPGLPWLTVWADRPFSDLVGTIYDWYNVGLAVLLTVLIVVRLGRLRQPDRGLMRPVAVGTVIGAAASTGTTVLDLANAGVAAHDAGYLLEGLGLLALPIAFLLAASRRWLSRESVPALIRRLGSAATPAQVQRALRERLRDPSLTVLYRVEDGAAGGPGARAAEVYADVHGTPVVAPEPGDPRVVAATPTHPPAVMIMADPVLRWQSGMGQALARTAGLVLENTRLQAQIAQVSSSAQRLRDAVTAERRRVQVDVDSISDDLLAATRQLDGAGGGPDTAPVPALESALAVLREAADELKQLAVGQPPTELTAHGLGPAVRAAAAGHNRPITVGVPDHRYPPSVEVAAYFVISELVTNAVKHARAPAITVTVTDGTGPTDSAGLLITVTDDGRGGADPNGSGLTGVTRRLESVGGSLAVHSPPGGGSRIAAWIPFPGN